MLFRTSTLLALACAACSAPRSGPVSDAPPVSGPEVSAPAQPTEPSANAAEQPAPEHEPAPTATASSDANVSGTATDASPQNTITPAEHELRSQVHRAVDDGDYARARTLLDDFFTVPQLDKARILLERGRPDEARVLTEQALSHAPGDRRALMMHGEACLRSGLRANDKALIERARLAFVQAGAVSTALLGASHAARELGRTDEALQLARDGWHAPAPDANDSGVPPCELAEFTVARAMWDAYAEERSAVNASAPRTANSTLFAETEGALMRLVERAPDNVWGWYQLGELYAGAGRLDDAQRALERGANALPADALIASSLAQVAQQRGGNAAVIAAFEQLEHAQPAFALPFWFAGRARFDDALAQLAAAPVDALRTAENEFGKCIARGGTQLGDAARFQAQCRSALGVCALHADQLDDALISFRSVGELYRGALGDEPSKALPSGAHGMELVADEFKKRSDPARAAKIYLELHKFDAKNLAWATSAGALHREAGEARQLIADDCALVAQGKITDARRIQLLRERAKIDGDLSTESRMRDQFRRKSEHLKEAVPGLYQLSWECYLDATKLAPDNIRVLTDCASVAVFYINTAVDEAEKLLRRAIDLGAVQVDGANQSEEQRLALREAWGDAYQNLGKLTLKYKNDPKAAKELFLRSVAIGPGPRPAVTDGYLPKCEKLLGTKKD
jgi:tetratricopeptide (TPR) repeat protein